MSDRNVRQRQLKKGDIMAKVRVKTGPVAKKKAAKKPAAKTAAKKPAAKQ
jgi:hypothetical protein